MPLAINAKAKQFFKENVKFFVSYLIVQSKMQIDDGKIEFCDKFLHDSDSVEICHLRIKQSFAVYLLLFSNRFLPTDFSA